MRTRSLAVALVVASAAPALAQSHPGDGTSHDLSGTWSLTDKNVCATLTLKHEGHGLHSVSGFRKGTAQVDAADTESGEVGVTFTIDPVGKGPTERWRLVARRDRTELVSTARTLSRTVPSGFTRVKIMHWNIEGQQLIVHPSLIGKYASVIRSERPDFVTMAEVKSFAFGGINQARGLADLAGGYDWTFATTHSSWGYGEGIAMLWRKGGPLDPKMEKKTVHDLPKDQNSNDLDRKDIVGDFELRSVGRRLRVVGTHMSKQNGFGKVSEDARSGPRPAILCGDMNADPNSHGPTLLRSDGLIDCWKRAHPGEAGYTNDNKDGQPYHPTRRVDYIWLAPDTARADGGARVLNLWLRAETPADGIAVNGRDDMHACLVAVVDLALPR